MEWKTLCEKAFPDCDFFENDAFVYVFDRNGTNYKIQKLSDHEGVLSSNPETFDCLMRGARRILANSKEKILWHETEKRRFLLNVGFGLDCIWRIFQSEGYVVERYRYSEFGEVNLMFLKKERLSDKEIDGVFTDLTIRFGKGEISLEFWQERQNKQPNPIIVIKTEEEARTFISHYREVEKIIIESNKELDSMLKQFGLIERINGNRVAVKVNKIVKNGQLMFSFQVEHSVLVGNLWHYYATLEQVKQNRDLLLRKAIRACLQVIKEYDYEKRLEAT